MTLILSCLTRRVVAQASDRRTTLPSGRVQEDEHNKAVFYCGHTVWAFTGVARLDGMPTADWLGETMAPATIFEAACSRVARGAQRAARQVPWTSGVREAERAQLRRLAFVGVGISEHDLIGGRWVRLPPFPLLKVISNFMMPSGERLSAALHDFVTYSQRLGPQDDVVLHEAGQQLPDDIRCRLTRQLLRAVRADAGPGALARLLGVAVQEVHDRGNVAVGRSIMTAAIPYNGRTPGDPSFQGGLWPLEPPADDGEYFRVGIGDAPALRYFYLPGSRAERVHYVPTSACTGVIMTGGRMQPVGDPAERQWSAEVKMKQIAVER